MSGAAINEADLISLVSDLVAIPSVNSMGLAGHTGTSSVIADYLKTWFTGKGLPCRPQPIAGGEVNLLVTLPGAAGGRSVLFDAHTDTVPADDWAERAFTPRVQGGRLYGRGACDTKGALAAMMWAMAAAARQASLPHTVVFLASADEECGRSGVHAFLESGVHVDAAVVGEPTGCELVIACKGAARWEIVVRGTSAHTSSPRAGINAIQRMANVIQVLGEFERGVLAARRHPLVDPPTLTPSVIRGGSAVNVVPDLCRVMIDLRTLPDEDPAEAMGEVQRFLRERLDFPVEHENAQLWRGAQADHRDAFVEHCARCCAGDEEAAFIAPLRGVNYGCHASDYAARGIPAVVLGPGSIGQAHAVDEYVEIADLVKAAGIYLKIMTTDIASWRTRS